MQATDGFDALVGANRGCYEAFAAVYECAVPVIAAVNGYCLGGGIGLVGNADIVVAAEDATFGLPEVDRGALGAATHLSRLVPQHKARAMVYTSATATATELHAFGSVLRVVAPRELRAAAREVAGQIAAKSPTVIRAAKESLNGIDLWDVKRSYRFEQGFTFELNLSGVADEHRNAFVEGRTTDTSR
jgi:enoyl-CoA hydratase